jgi:hypothetical protein
MGLTMRTYDIGDPDRSMRGPKRKARCSQTTWPSMFGRFNNGQQVYTSFLRGYQSSLA